MLDVDLPPEQEGAAAGNSKPDNSISTCDSAFSECNTMVCRSESGNDAV